MKINRPKNCGNAPKQVLIADLNVAFAQADAEAVSAFFHQDIQWEMVGDKTITGHEPVITFLKEMGIKPALELDLDTIVTHGKFAAARGTLHFKDQQVTFHDFYEFSSAGSNKVIKISSMAIAHQQQG